jgi:hypothetical protein
MKFPTTRVRFAEEFVDSELVQMASFPFTFPLFASLIRSEPDSNCVFGQAMDMPEKIDLPLRSED